MLNVECHSAPQLFRLPYQHMMIVEDFKNVGVFAIESQSEEESTRGRSVLHTQMDVCSCFLFISCHFLTFIDTRWIVLPEYCSVSACNIFSKRKLECDSVSACYCLHFCLWLGNCTLFFYRELKRYSLFNRNLSELLCSVSISYRYHNLRL